MGMGRALVPKQSAGPQVAAQPVGAQGSQGAAPGTAGRGWCGG
jgi:hypothetical protein